MLSFKSKVTVVAFVTGMSVNAVLAEEVNYGSTIPTAQQLVDALKPEKRVFEAKTRGIVIKVRKQDAAKPAVMTSIADQSVAGSAQDEQKNAASLQIQFEFDSDKLSDYAELQLQPLGQALQSAQLAGIAFTLEGHTDAAGSLTYNQALSERRANSIKQYLVNHYQISETNLNAVGMGERDLLLPKSPHDGANRRVRIVSQL